MKKFRMVLFSIVLVLGMAGAASAVTLTDVTLFTATGTTQAEDYVSHGWGDVNFLSPPTENPLHGKLPGGRSHTGCRSEQPIWHHAGSQPERNHGQEGRGIQPRMPNRRGLSTATSQEGAR